MCQIGHKVYTVCTHVYEHSAPCTLTSRTRVRCANPEVVTGARFGFCQACRDFYEPLATDCPYFILAYWSYKADRGVKHAVHPSYVPHGELFWVSSDPVKEYQKRVHSPRNDLSTLAKVFPRFRGETQDEYIERLQFIRHATLEWAGRRRKERIQSEEVVYPPVKNSPRPSLTPSKQLFEESVTVRDPPQAHDETLARLCGTWKGISSEEITDPQPECLTKCGPNTFQEISNRSSYLIVSRKRPETRREMASPQAELLRRPLYLYDLPTEVITTLSLKTDADANGGLSVQDDTTTTVVQTPSPATADNMLGSQACSLCSLSFVTVQDQREHLKTDLHHYNLKQKLHGLNPVSEAEFEKLVDQLDESISGSESEDNEDEEQETGCKETTLTALLKKQATLADKRKPNDEGDEETKQKRGTGKTPLLWFESPKLPERTYYGIYRALFTAEELEKEDAIVEAIKKRQLAPISMPKPPKDAQSVLATYKGQHIFMCMIGGGHFAAMVVSLTPKKSKHGTTGPLNREAVVLAHKTFHRYTTRRKQGGSQSANDNAKGTAHSAGSSLRRYNEQALVEDVRNLLKDWKNLIDTSDLLFIRATGMTNRRTLFGPYEGQVLRTNDPRIRGFPFNTRRATQNELMRSFIELTRLKVKEIQPEPEASAAEPSKTPKSNESKPPAPKLSEEEEAAIFHTTQIQSIIRRSKLPALLSYLTNNNLDANFLFQPKDTQQNHHTPTLLHFAASQNSAAVIVGLITRAGADPTILNSEGKTPFDLAGDRATRDAFRVARSEAGEQKWDWEAAHVSVALKKEDADKRAEREKKEEEKRRKAEEERLKKEGPVVKESKPRKGGVLGGAPLNQREEETRGLTAEQKMKLDRERRARAAEERIRRLQGGA
ncbi:hypothetical protein QBC36DRAFT_296943 [Triangularia setosa]|uniref:VLRF1 domain-containing protein n=1 Tax=Triangularia setosa TaxID=2587417 RepID=A0AAN6WG50_9PEZI|nr:hypothetical protein QBC36DRAFT_296943 [Podospora setosa]